jgi:hypothetical protein
MACAQHIEEDSSRTALLILHFYLSKVSQVACPVPMQSDIHIMYRSGVSPKRQRHLVLDWMWPFVSLRI